MDFGSILDDIRSVGDDVKGFFSGTLGSALQKGAIGILDSKDAEKANRTDLRENFDSGYYRQFTTRQAPDDLKSSDYSSAEIEWLKRLHRFASLDTGTDVKLGGK